MILFILVALLLLTVVSGTYVFIVACVRRKDLPWMVEEKIKKTPYGKYYDLIVTSDRWLKEHGAQDLYTFSDDGLKLHGYWVPAKNAKGTMLLVHGYRSTLLVDFGPAMEFYHNRGMNLLIPDQRCHGKSEGRYITFGVKESADILCWINTHNDRFGACPVILSGLSMGATTVLFLADKTLPDNVKGIIADCGFTSPKEILARVFKRVTHLPSIPSLWITDLFARLFAGFSLSERDTRETLKNNRLPIIMVHGKCDDFVPCEMTQQGFAACTGTKQLLLVDDAGHGVSFLVDKERYTAMIMEFLEKHVEH